MKENIILIGFMGSGKSTIGRELAKALEMKFIDTDDYIEEKESNTIAEIFAQKGEKYFRKKESEYVEEISKLNHTVIATGGGVAASDINMEILKKSGFVIYLNCTIDCIHDRVVSRNTRPLLNGYPDLKLRIKELLEARVDNYEKHMDKSIDIDKKSNLWDTVDLIKNIYITAG